LTNFSQNDPTNVCKEQVLAMLKVTVTTRTSDDACKMIAQTLKKSKQIFEQLRNAKQTVEMSRKKAVWIE